MAVSTEGDERADPVARLKTIRLEALRNACPEDIDKLVVAATHDGIFYLSFEDDDQLSRAITGMQSLGIDLFNLDMEQKMAYDIDKLGQYKLNGSDAPLKLPSIRFIIVIISLTETTDTNQLAEMSAASKVSVMALRATR